MIPHEFLNHAPQRLGAARMGRASYIPGFLFNTSSSLMETGMALALFAAADEEYFYHAIVKLAYAQHGISTIATFDADFAKYRSVQVIMPKS